MPRMVKLVPNTNPTVEMKKHPDWAEIKERGGMTVDYPTAKENIKRTGGMYQIEETVEVTTGPPRFDPPDLESLSNEELKMMMLQTGVKTEKQMKRADIISTIRKKLDEIDIVDDTQA